MEQSPNSGRNQQLDLNTQGVDAKTDVVQLHQFDWESILQQHESWLRSIVYARLGEPQAVDDVMQEVALAAVRQSAPIHDPNKVSPWLYRLAIRQCLLYRRKRGRQRKLLEQFSERYQPTDLDQQNADPLSWLLADERRSQIREAMGRLHRRDAEILLLKYTEGWSYKQLAEHIGISHSAVEARLHRARGRLRNELTAAAVVEMIQ